MGVLSPSHAQHFPDSIPAERRPCTAPWEVRPGSRRCERGPHSVGAPGPIPPLAPLSSTVKGDRNGAHLAGLLWGEHRGRPCQAVVANITPGTVVIEDLLCVLPDATPARRVPPKGTGPGPLGAPGWGAGSEQVTLE